jgi:hypothetical protein
LSQHEDAIIMSITIETLLQRNLHEVFGERDPARRAVAIEALFTPDCVFSDPHGHYVGRAALDDAVSALHERFPDHAFSEIGAPEALRDSGRLAWSFGPPDDPQQVTGLDVIVVNAGRIAALYTFLNPARA